MDANEHEVMSPKTVDTYLVRYDRMDGAEILLVILDYLGNPRIE